MAVNTKVSVTTANTMVINTSIKGCVITNYGTVGVVWLQVGQPAPNGTQPAAVVGEGIPLAPAATAGGIGGQFSLLDMEMSQKPIQAISSA